MAKDTKSSELPLTEEVQRQQESMPTTVSVNPHYLIQKAIESGNIDAVERIVALTERLQAKWARDQYFGALSRFQKDCPVIERSTQVDFTSKSGSRTKYRYASMDALILAKNEVGETIQALLEKHGFSYETKTKQTEKELTAILVSHHRDGHSEETSLTVPIDFESHMSPPQRVRSARTYAIRTDFEDAFGLVTANPDDDGDAGATEGARNGLADGETERMMPEPVSQQYWSAWKSGDKVKQQAALIGQYGPAKRYDVRKVDDASAPKGYAWKAFQINDAGAEPAQWTPEGDNGANLGTELESSAALATGKKQGNHADSDIIADIGFLITSAPEEEKKRVRELIAKSRGMVNEGKISTADYLTDLANIAADLKQRKETT